MNKHILAALLCTTAILTACGGGGGDGGAASAPEAAVPHSASASSAGLRDYILALSKEGADAEPLDLGAFAPLQPDDTEPEPVD
jgi:hypothetical protein